ncbi:VF530 family protein (plasmid) [Pseudoalteromonas sp. CF6-2]|uniref:VF530 family protein n=1 Tax=Pseudoalteromonas sp. CF6-2 TaxID=562716 RepID=UPI001F18DC25|nr:VF530 family protein [Pseudoalteromonas sp. CF6-2]
MDNQPNNPLHGVKLADIVTKLQEKFGWDGLAAQIDVRCFQNDPSVKSSLKFLRKTPWAREKVEQLYIDTFSNTADDDDAPFQWKSIKK